MSNKIRNKHIHTNSQRPPKHDHDVFIPPRIPDDPLYEPDEEERKAMEAAKQLKRIRKVRRVKKLRIRKKRLQARNRRLTVVGIVFLIILCWLFLRLAPVSFGALIVDGNDRMTNDEVYQACGVSGYVNVIQLSPGDIQERLRKDLRITDATVERVFPATIHVTMKERQAAAVITTMYGFAYIDDMGKVMELGPQIKGVSVPIMTGKKMDTILLGDTITDPSIRAALIYLQNLSPDVLKTITEVNVGNPDELIAYTSDSLPIHLGSGNDAAERAAITEELLQEVKNTDVAVQYIDTDIRVPLVKSK